MKLHLSADYRPFLSFLSPSPCGAGSVMILEGERMIESGGLDRLTHTVWDKEVGYALMSIGQTPRQHGSKQDGHKDL